MRTIKEKGANLPKPLYQVRTRFDRWRKTHPPRTRFSGELWSEAVAIAREYGHSRTAQVLGLDYYSLKKHLADTPAVNRENSKNTSPFIELIPQAQAQAECVIDIEDCEGKKMRISLKGGTMPDLLSLSRSFWSKEA